MSSASVHQFNNRRQRRATRPTPASSAVATALAQAEYVKRALEQWRIDVQVMLLYFAESGAMCYPGHHPDLGLSITRNQDGLPVARVA